MNSVLIFASTTGNTEYIAMKLARKLSAEMVHISKITQDLIRQYDVLVLCASTWGRGELQDDWAKYLDSLVSIDLKLKTIALCILGDQKNYSETFAGAGVFLYEAFKNKGAHIIGFTSTDGYNYVKSPSQINGRFIGLVIDEDNQSQLTDKRIDDWCAKIKIEYARTPKS